MGIDGVNIGQELLNVPMGDMIQSMALSIAKAQWQLDKSSMTVAELMSGRRVLRDLDTGALIGPNGAKAKSPEVLDSRVYFGYTIDLDPATKQPVRVPQLMSMMELGFTPTFYQFVDTIIEVKIAISMRSETSDVKVKTDTTNQNKNEVENKYSSDYSYRGCNYWGWFGYGYGGSSSSSSDREVTNTVTTSQVNAAYSQKYGYTADGASLLRTKLVPVPPPSILEDRIREVMRIENAYEQWNILNLLRSKLETERDALPLTDTKGRDDKIAQIKALDERVNVALDTLVNAGGSA